MKPQSIVCYIQSILYTSKWNQNLATWARFHIAIGNGSELRSTGVEYACPQIESMFMCGCSVPCVRESLFLSLVSVSLLLDVGGLTQTARPLSKSKWYVCRLDCSDSLFPPDRKLITDVLLLLYHHSTDHPDCPFTLYMDCRSDWYCIPSRSFMYLSVFSQSVWFCCQEARQRGGECVPSFCRAGPRTARDCHHQLH